MCGLAFPDAQADVLRARQIDGNAERAVAELVLAAKVLDDLRPERCATVGAESELAVNAAPTLTARPHNAPGGRSSLPFLCSLCTNVKLGSAWRRITAAMTPIGRGRRAAGRHLVLVAALLAVGGAGAAAIVAVAFKSANPVPAIATDCGRSVSGPGFRVFSCMSGGAGAGHPHPKELLVIRDDGSSAAYPVFRTGELAAGNGEVIATYDLSLVRVTSNRLVPLLTNGELARALHVRPTAIWDIHDPRIDAHGDISFMPSVFRHSGCQNPLLELTAGTVHRIQTSTSRDCS